MTGPYHWTLIVLLQLCAGCLILNAVQWQLTRTVRMSGVLVCICWAVQQAWWLQTGDANPALMLACDALLIAYFISRYPSNDWTDWLIFALIPATMALYLPASLYGQTVEGWWLNWALVALQMMLGLPRPASQHSLSFYSHGSRQLRGIRHGGA